MEMCRLIELVFHLRVKLLRLRKDDRGRFGSAAQAVIELNKRGQVYKIRQPDMKNQMQTETRRNKQIRR